MPAGLPAAARHLRLQVRRFRPARCRPALSRCLRIGGRAQRRRGVGRRRGAGRARDPRLDRSAAAGRSRARRAERGRESEISASCSAWRLWPNAPPQVAACWPKRSPIFPRSMAPGSRRNARSSAISPPRRRETAEQLIADMESARQRIRARHRDPVAQRSRAHAHSAS